MNCRAPPTPKEVIPPFLQKEKPPNSLQKLLHIKEIKDQQILLVPGHFLRGISWFISKYGSPNTVSQWMRLIQFDKLISKSSCENPPLKFPKEPKWCWDRKESHPEAHQVGEEQGFSFHEERRLSRSPTDIFIRTLAAQKHPGRGGE